MVSSQPRLRSKLPGSWLRAPFRWPKVGRAHLAGACLARRALQLRANFSRLQVQPAPPASPRNPGGGGGIEASQPLPPSPSAPLPSSPLPARPSRPKRGRGELLSSARLRAPPRQPPTRPAEGLRSTAAQPLRPGASARAHTYTDTQHTLTHTHTKQPGTPARPSGVGRRVLWSGLGDFSTCPQRQLSLSALSSLLKGCKLQRVVSLQERPRPESMPPWMPLRPPRG